MACATIHIKLDSIGGMGSHMDNHAFTIFLHKDELQFHNLYQKIYHDCKPGDYVLNITG